MLHTDAVLVVDGGGRVRAPLEPVEGREGIVETIVRFFEEHVEAATAVCSVNAEPGIAFHAGGEVVGVLTVGLRAERIDRLWLVANPDKLRDWRH
ncbi:hypothetical protein ACH3VR_14440 [Microbacterium sp. B2969]|uniref:Siderophore-interacting protein C-terminal domain-containing protein n=1 Tax=Microbacterium alkaliflavum TaxID=3248839 RepID=A0ABW7QDP4_9MICO